MVKKQNKKVASSGQEGNYRNVVLVCWLTKECYTKTMEWISFGKFISATALQLLNFYLNIFISSLRSLQLIVEYLISILSYIYRGYGFVQRKFLI